MELEVYKMNSFASQSGGGNPCAVILLEEDLGIDLMQTIARRIGFSETAFVRKSDLADYKVRYFTPLSEVNLCGHATIGVFSLLRHLDRITTGIFHLETLGGVLEIQVKEDEVLMEMERAHFHEEVSPDLILDALNASSDILPPTPVPQIVSTGLKDLIIPVKSRFILDDIRPDMDKVAKLSREHQIAGFHLYALDDEVTAYTRNFAPGLGIPEESATGTASGALAAYLFHHRPEEIVDDLMIFRQGYAMGRPSEIRVQLVVEQGIPRKIYVGGNVTDIAMCTMEF